MRVSVIKILRYGTWLSFFVFFGIFYFTTSVSAATIQCANGQVPGRNCTEDHGSGPVCGQEYIDCTGANPSCENIGSTFQGCDPAFGGDCYITTDQCFSGDFSCSGATPCGTPGNCYALNACNSCGNLPAGYGDSCTSPPNACGDTNLGTIGCNGCSATTPSDPAGYRDPCTLTSSANACGATRTCPGTKDCSGTCIGTCDPPDMPVGYENVCDDGNACTTGETIGCGGCGGGASVNCDDSNVCTTDSCDPFLGCDNTPNTKACSDGSLCTTGDICSNGSCVGTLTECNAMEPCVSGSCSLSTGECIYPAVVLPMDCDDGNSCTQNDKCSAVTGCKGSPYSCPLGPCTLAICDGSGGCAFANNGALCPGGACDGSGNCVPSVNCGNGSLNAGEACDTGISYSNEACGSGACNGTRSKTCNASCSGFDYGNCSSYSLSCTADSNVCTTDTCDATGACIATNNTASCNDGLSCNGTDTCGGGSCSIHSNPTGCGGSVCGDASVTGSEACDTGISYSTETCGSGACNGTRSRTCNASCSGFDYGNCSSYSLSCTADSNVCTTDTCNSIGACIATNNTASCDDGLYCTVSDICSSGSCNGSGRNCSDGNTCTNDSCNEVTNQCDHPNNTASCDDGMSCNGTDTCSGGSCSAHSNPTGCASTCGNGILNAGETCDTGILYSSEACGSGGCSGGTRTRTCNATCSGFNYGNCSTYNTSCNDGLFCNNSDLCDVLGVCTVHGSNPCLPLNTTDANCSTSCNEAIDACNAQDPGGTGCNDSNACTNPDTCTAGVCGGPSVCSSANLIAENLSITGTLIAGQTLSFSGTVRNSGSVAAGAVSQTRVRVDIGRNGTWDVNPANQSTENLAAGASETETWSNAWAGITAGNHRMEVCADATSVVAESSDSDNCATYDFTVSPLGSCDPNAIGSNQMLGCSYSGMSFGTLTGATLTGPALSSPAPANGTPIPYQNWGTGGPNGLTNNYSVRFKGRFYFTTGTYAFHTGSDDGSRAYFDDDLNGVPDNLYLVYAWYDHSYSITVNSGVNISEGYHNLIYEFYENGGDAAYYLYWTSVPCPSCAVCNNTWRSIPGGGITSFQPVGTMIGASLDSQYKNSVGVAVRGNDSATYFQNCNFATTGNECVWSGSWTSLGGSTTHSPAAYTAGAWDVEVRGGASIAYRNTNWGTGWTGWGSFGAIERNWGQPFRFTDRFNRTWQLRKDPGAGTISYNCGGNACVGATFSAPNSSFVPVTVASGGAFTAYCDYNIRGMDAIGVTVAGGGSCTYDTFTTGTQARFNCIAPASGGSYAVACTNNVGTSQNFCAASNSLGNITVNAPSAITLSTATMTFSGISGSAAPAGQTFTVRNSGGAGSTLIWRATTNQNWCFVNGVGNGTFFNGANLASGATSPNLTVTMSAPSNAGGPSCTITVSNNGSSPAPSNSPQIITVTYNVQPSNVSLVTSSLTACPARTVNLSWVAANSGATAKTYTIYRSTVNNPAMATSIASGITATTYADSPLIGSTYYYWVETVSGGFTSPNRTASVPASQVVPACPAAPTITLSPPSFTFNGISGGATPVTQNLVITNSGPLGSTLNWTWLRNPAAGAGTWCRLQTSAGVDVPINTGGSLASGVSATYKVAVLSPSNTGSFTDCGIRINDPSASNNPQNVSLTYTVTPSNPTVVNSSLDTCPSRVVTVSWTASLPVGTTYTLYRNTVNNSTVGVTTLASGIAGTSRTDTPPVGSTYWYWVEANNGGQSSSRVATNPVSQNVSACVASPAISLNPVSMNFNGISGGATPVTQNLVITNSGPLGSTLNWTWLRNPAAGAGTWCRLQTSAGVDVPINTGGSLASGVSATYKVAVLSPSNTGSFTDCGIRINDPSASNNPQNVSLTYTVTPSNPGGPPSSSLAACPSRTVTINWTASLPVGTTYTLYRNTVNNSTVGVTTLASGIAGTSRTDTPPVGSTYWYWVEANNGGQSSSRVATNPISQVVPACPAAPTITLSPASFTFNGVSGGAAPAAQNLTIQNTGGAGSNLLYRAQTNQTWCRVNGINSTGSITGGPLAQNASVNVSVTMDNPSTAGSFPCVITVSDNGSSPTATNSPQTRTATYVVKPGDTCVGASCGACSGGTCSGGASNAVNANTAICPTSGVVLTWVAGVGATSYNIYSNTHLGAPVLLAGNIGNVLTYIDITGSIGVYYDYWVEAIGGSLTSTNKVAANTNAGAGIAKNLCTITTPTVSPPPSTSGVNCGTIKVSFQDGSIGETEFRIYRSTVDNGALAGAPIATIVSTTSLTTGTTYTYNDTSGVAGTVYYYWVTAFGGGMESDKSGGGSSASPVSCNADLGVTNKDIAQVNGVVPSGYAVDTCGVAGNQSPPGVVYKIGDIIAYQINLCAKNTMGGYSATSITMTDTMYNLGTINGTVPNLGSTTAELIAAYGMSVTLPLHIQSVSVVSVDYPSSVKLNIVFNPADALAPGTSAIFTMQAKTSLPASFSGTSSRFQNGMSVTYDRDGSGPGVTTSTNYANTPLLMFRKVIAPSKVEIAP